MWGCLCFWFYIMLLSSVCPCNVAFLFPMLLLLLLCCTYLSLNMFESFFFSLNFITFRYHGEAGNDGSQVFVAYILQEWQRP